MEKKVEVSIAPALRKLVGDAVTLQAQGRTVGQVLENLNERFPGFLERMINHAGDLRSSIFVSLNEEDIRSLQGLKTSVHDGDTMDIHVILSGG